MSVLCFHTHTCTGVHTHSLFVWAYTGSVVSTMERWSAGHNVQHRRCEKVLSLSASQEQQHSGAAWLAAHRTNVQGSKEHSVWFISRRNPKQTLNRSVKGVDVSPEKACVVQHGGFSPTESNAERSTAWCAFTSVCEGRGNMEVRPPNVEAYGCIASLWGEVAWPQCGSAQNNKQPLSGVFSCLFPKSIVFL